MHLATYRGGEGGIAKDQLTIPHVDPSAEVRGASSAPDPAIGTVSCPRLECNAPFTGPQALPNPAAHPHPHCNLQGRPMSYAEKKRAFNPNCAQCPVCQRWVSRRYLSRHIERHHPEVSHRAEPPAIKPGKYGQYGHMCPKEAVDALTGEVWGVDSGALMG